MIPPCTHSGPSFDRPADPAIAPSPWVVRWASLIRPSGTVLDIAAGHGRHTRALAGAGHRVTAVDFDASGMVDLATDPRVEIVDADLESGAWPFAQRVFDAVVVTNYLHRPHFPHLIAALAEGGVLIIETFGRSNEHFGRPRNPHFLLAPGELLAAFGGQLHIVAYEHGAEQSPRPAVRQRICAVKGEGPVNLLLWPRNI